MVKVFTTGAVGGGRKEAQATVEAAAVTITVLR